MTLVSEPLNELERLICHGGFRDRGSLLSFALSVGVFNGRKGDESYVPERIDVGSLSSFSTAAVVVAYMSNKRLTMDDMRRELRSYLAGGLLEMAQAVENRGNREALIVTARMIPP